MHDLRTLFSHQLRSVVVVAALGALVPLQVAAEVADPAFNRFRSQVVGNSVNFSFGGNGTPLAGAGNSTGIGVTGGVDVGRAVSINTKHGPVTGTLKQKISNAAMGRAFGRAAAFIGGPVGLAFLALPVIVDWMSDNGVRPAAGGGFEALDQEACTTAPCYEYRYSQLQAWSRSYATACTAGFAAIQGNSTTTVYRYTHFIQPNQCEGTRSINGATPTRSAINVERRTASVETPGYLPITPVQLESRMSFNTSPEALAELYKLGGDPNFNTVSPVPDLVDTLRAEFEARSPESVDTTTIDSPSETKTEQKTCATYTEIIGSTLYLREDCSTETTTQAKDPETGLPVGDPVTTTTQQSSTRPDPATKENEAAEDPCLTAPNRVACIELGTAVGDVPTSTRNVDFEQEELFGGGTCPSDQTFTFRATVLPITNYAQACDLLQTYVRPMAILLAFVAGLMILTRGMPE